MGDPLLKDLLKEMEKNGSRIPLQVWSLRLGCGPRNYRHVLGIVALGHFHFLILCFTHEPV